MSDRVTPHSITLAVVSMPLWALAVVLGSVFYFVGRLTKAAGGAD